MHIVRVRFLEKTAGREKDEMFRGPLRRVLFVAYFYVCVFDALFQGLLAGIKGYVETVSLDGAAPVEDFCGLSLAGLLGSVGRSVEISRVRQRENVTFRPGHRGIEQGYRPAWSCVGDAGDEARDADNGHQAYPTKKKASCAFNCSLCQRIPSPKPDHLDFKNILIPRLPG